MKIVNNNIELNLINGDCMDYLPKMSDHEFDLAIIDPPYGIGESNRCNNRHRQYFNIYHTFDWDDKPADPEFFIELKRVSKNQIIWGANHFLSNFPVDILDSPCWIFWDKNRESQDFADGELAWTSFKSAVRQFTFLWDGFRQGDMKNKEKRIHPTQKPVKLYEWLLKNYAQKGDKILDTHLGSGSSVIACYNLDFSITGFEIDKVYYDAMIERIKEHMKQGRLFDIR